MNRWNAERIICGHASYNATTTDQVFARNQFFEQNETKNNYIVIWIDETGESQTDSGTFKATIKFNYASDAGVTSTIVPMSYMTGFTSGSDYSYYRSDTYCEKIKNVYFVDYIDISKWDVSKVTIMQAMFAALDRYIMQLITLDTSK